MPNTLPPYWNRSRTCTARIVLTSFFGVLQVSCKPPGFQAATWQKYQYQEGPTRLLLEGHFHCGGEKRISQFTVSHDSQTGQSPKAFLNKLIADYVAKAGEVTFAVSACMERKHDFEESMKGAGHTVFMYPENLSDLHLSDVLF